MIQIRFGDRTRTYVLGVQNLQMTGLTFRVIDARQQIAFTFRG
jgi:hypothetical protein